ncbi:peptidase domain-containing ABC transporter [Pacificispira sp.]|uniref:peptidase domain-containing ABC transporter n=1 Tax=Pacificispira sp. TaxID=2888761 RepID=UPI003B524812
MGELLARLRRRPAQTTLMLIASVLANILGLASSLYVIQVLNRYVSHGVDATLLTLTVGVGLAILFELGFRWSRMRLAAAVSGEPDHRAGIGAFGILTTAKLGALERMSSGDRREAISGLEQVESAYSAPNLTAMMDLPFALLYLGAIFLFSPPLALIVLIALCLVMVLGLVNQIALRPMTRKLTEHQAVGHGLIGTTTSTAESVRAFGAGDQLITDWAKNLSVVQGLRRRLARRQGGLQSLTQSIQGIMSAGVIAFGATLVVIGELDVGMMIGANLLAARAMQPVTRFAQLSEALVKSRQAMERAKSLAELPVEPGEGAALRTYSGKLELRDLAYTAPGAPAPLFEDLNVVLEAGSVVALIGRNGAGKTTMARLIAGLVEPSRGQILADDVDLRQIVPAWWRRQIVYLPQEPTFINATIRDNLKLLNPDLTDEALEAILERSGAARFVHETEKGLDTMVVNNGLNMARGERRRLAVARALASGGRLVLFDEPTEGMDEEGVRQIYETLVQLARAGRTIIVSSHDPQIIRGAQMLIDLDAKPKPEIRMLSKDAGATSQNWNAGARGGPPVKPKAAE